MDKLLQTENMLLASKDAENNLENKESARILVVSDSHGESELLEEIIQDFGPGCDVLVFCGDGICDIVACLERRAVNRHLCEAFPPVVAVVRGNGDAEQYAVSLTTDDNGSPVPPFQLTVPRRVLFRAAGRTILALHGHVHSVDFGTEMLASAASAMDADMVFYGHTHVPLREEIEATLIVNPGSCVRPRGGFPPSFAIVNFPGTTERYETEFFQVNKGLFGNYSFTPLAWNI